MTVDHKKTKADESDAIRKDTDVKGERPARREKDVVTEGSEDSFPASDPPSYMAGSAISGSPPSRKTDDEDQDAGKAKDKAEKKK
jgi:hypothetical protein